MVSWPGELGAAEVECFGSSTILFILLMTDLEVKNGFQQNAAAGPV
jgi:hypothetical protein